MPKPPPFYDRVAADYVVTMLGGAYSPTVGLLLRALRAGWLTPEEAASLERLAVAVAYLAERDVPAHRGVPCGGAASRPSLTKEER